MFTALFIPLISRESEKQCDIAIDSIGRIYPDGQYGSKIIFKDGTSELFRKSPSEIQEYSDKLISQRLRLVKQK
jgi:hypothetical protein